MKTAMKSLITHLEMLNHRASTVPVDSLIDTIKVSYLNLEKEQIMNAYEHGYEACDMDEAMEVNKKLTSGDLYYNMNYNQNK